SAAPAAMALLAAAALLVAAAPAAVAVPVVPASAAGGLLLGALLEAAAAAGAPGRVFQDVAEILVDGAAVAGAVDQVQGLVLAADDAQGDEAVALRVMGDRVVEPPAHHVGPAAGLVLDLELAEHARGRRDGDPRLGLVVRGRQVMVEARVCFVR